MPTIRKTVTKTPTPVSTAAPQPRSRDRASTSPIAHPKEGNDRGGRQRHGCLTAWLVLVILVNSLNVVLGLFVGSAMAMVPGWAVAILAVSAVANIACAVALFRWKKWGFYGFAAMSLVALVVNLTNGVGIARAALGFIGIAILYAVLQLGRDKSGWTQLE